jgi:GT2 family glycosyltransferase
MPNNQTFPFVSIVICTFNRGKLIDACLESLDSQTYPRDRFEVIIVDDGSTDDTSQIAGAHPGVQLIRKDINSGPAAARNTGIAVAKGEIIASIDDDAVADPRWLERLVEPFDAPEVTVAGGRTFAYKTDSLAERYLSAIGSGNPAPLAFGTSNHPLWRFWAYLKSMFSPISIVAGPTEVQAVYTLNAAYRISALKAVGGFDETLFYDEDSDMATRLRQRGAHIIFIPDAIVHHRHRESLRKLIRQTYRNAENTVRYYAKEKKILPIFPLPLLYIVLAIGAIIIQPMIGGWFIVLGPLVLYGWWPVRAFRTHRLEYFVYGYIQLTLELVSVLGLVRGKFRSMKNPMV